MLPKKDPYKLSQTEQFVEFAANAAIIGVLIFSFLKVLFL
jgi:hypothetical protein